MSGHGDGTAPGGGDARSFPGPRQPSGPGRAAPQRRLVPGSAPVVVAGDVGGRGRNGRRRLPQPPLSAPAGFGVGERGTPPGIRGQTHPAPGEKTPG